MSGRKKPVDPHLRVRLELALKRAGVSQAELARRVGREPASVSHWLSGRNEPTRQMLPVIEKALGTSPGFLSMVGEVSESERSTERTILDLARQDESGRLKELLESMDYDEIIARLERPLPRANRSPRK